MRQNCEYRNCESTSKQLDSDFHLISSAQPFISQTPIFYILQLYTMSQNKK